MKKLFLTLFLTFIYTFCQSQTCPTTIFYDHMETYTWFGNWSTPANTGFYTNASVSPSASGALIGAGNGSSGIESAIYVLPNITGLNIAYTYKVKFRLGSYRISNPTAATAGVDGADYIDLRYSTNNGTTYITEMRIAGNANAYWDYNLLGVATKTANGLITTYAPTAGGNRTATGDGYSVIELTLPLGITQLSVQLACRVNSAGEEWWLDDIDLIELAPCSPLPIELISFTGEKKENYNFLTWVSATEINNDYYTLERSNDGVNWVFIVQIKGAGTTTYQNTYFYDDNDNLTGINYYRLSQTDYNGLKEYFNIISIENNTLTKPKTLIKIINMLGQEINENATGLIIYMYSDGTIKKTIK
jgi:hypothetical protein